MYDDKKYPKYSWIEIDLVKHPSDFRLESYMPRNGLDEPIGFIERIGTDSHWAARKEYVYKEVFTLMNELVSLSKSENRSLGTLKPLRILDFIIEETDRERKPQWQEKLKQLRMFDLGDDGKAKPRKVIRKVPYIFKYRFT